MKKITFLLVSILILTVTMFSFTACGADGTDGKDGKSAYQIWLDAGNTGSEAQFLEWLKGNTGATGPQGPAGPIGPQGESGAQEFKIYKMGETFTYTNAGIELFSITVRLWSENPNVVVEVLIKNINMLGYAPNSFVNMRIPRGSGYLTATFSTTILPLGEEIIDATSYYGESLLYFGFPTGSAIIPYAIFTTV